MPWFPDFTNAQSAARRWAAARPACLSAAGLRTSGRCHCPVRDSVRGGDVDTIANLFGPAGYYREPIGSDAVHEGTDEIRSYFKELLSNGGIGVQHCAVTDDGVRCAVEYNCIRWGAQALEPQAGLTVYQRSLDGLLAAARSYDDIELPVPQHESGGSPGRS
jgi:hypothetical protein